MSAQASGYLLLIVTIYVLGVLIFFGLRKFKKDMKAIEEKHKNKKKEIIAAKKSEFKFPIWVHWIFWPLVAYGVLETLYEKINGYAPSDWWEPFTVILLPFVLVYSFLSEHSEGIGIFFVIIALFWFGTNVISLLRQINQELERIRRSLDK